MKKAVQILVHGKVQGVHFRMSTKHVADQLKIRGTVQNNTDGTVFIEAEGDAILLQEFVEWCKVRPEKAEVAWIDVVESEVKALQNFVIHKKGVSKT